MTVGFTGTRRGMTAKQLSRCAVLFGQLDITAVHHGGCVGADIQFHTLARAATCFITVHPSTSTTRAHPRELGMYDIAMTEKPPLIRNRDIVNAGELLIATPKLDVEEQRSGTWAAIRYARKIGKPIILIYPSIVRFEPPDHAWWAKVKLP